VPRILRFFQTNELGISGLRIVALDVLWTWKCNSMFWARWGQ